MGKRPIASIHSLTIEHKGRKYGVVVQRYNDINTNRIMNIWDRDARIRLPLQDIEREYAKETGSNEAMTIRSKWAARRRAKQYLRIWDKIQVRNEQ